MKKILLSLVLFSLLIMMPMGVAMAQPETVPDTSITSFGAALSVIDGFVDWLYAFLLLAAAFYLIWGALDYVLGGGDAAKIESGRNKIKYALIGVAIAVVSKGLITMVMELLA